MKKFVITEEEKKQIRSLYENEFLIEGESIPNFMLRRWDKFKKHFDSEFEFSSICHFKKDDDLDGYVKYVSRTVAQSLFLSTFDLKSTTQEVYENFIHHASEFIKDNFKDEIEKHYELKEC